jgi:DNA-directed RNA polymerase specialized sigma24 family protein
LDTSALVNETFIKLLQQREKWRNREHFFAIATRAMGAKEAIHTTLPIPDLEAMFATLESTDSGAARVAKLRILLGLEHEEIADVLAISRSTGDRDWRFATAWINDRL